jgi:hypothetical protein
MYVWLLLYYLYSNLYKESIIKMGSFAPPLWGKKETIEKEIARLEKELAVETDEKKKVKLQSKIDEFKEELAKDEK